MSLIKAIAGSINGVAADQYREYFYCDALPDNVLVTKGHHRTSSKFGTKNNSNDNLISNGSVIAVNEGQCMIIVDQGKVAEFCAEAGEFLYDTSSEPSLLYGSLGENIKKTFAQIGRRFTFGGDTGKDQRVYFFNTKEIMNNTYGSQNPIPFRVVDNNIGLDVDVSVRCHGDYSYHIIDPLLFYTHVCGNVTEEYTKDKMDKMLKAEIVTQLGPALAKISDLGIRYNQVNAHAVELTKILNELLDEKWSQTRGIEIVSFNMAPLTLPPEDQKMITELQKTAVYRNPNMAGAALIGAQAEAMKAAASNTSTGPMMAFAGMNMAAGAGGMNAANLFAMGQQQQAQAAPAQAAPAQAAGGAAAGWKCSCGAMNTGKFCKECGSQRPAPSQGWTCSCGAVNEGKFCQECGSKKPADAPLYRCDKCGWQPADPHHPPKFCPECGDVFDENDIQ